MMLIIFASSRWQIILDSLRPIVSVAPRKIKTINDDEWKKQLAHQTAQESLEQSNSFLFPQVFPAR